MTPTQPTLGSVVLAHPTGNTFVRATARTLYAAGWLRAFYTTVAAPSSQTLKWLPASARRQILRRRFSEVPRSVVKTTPRREMVRLAAIALQQPWLTRPGRWASVDAVYQQFDRHVARQIGRGSPADRPALVYAYEDAADETFAAARTLGATCVYELPIAYWQTTQRLLREEATRLPEWRHTLGGLDDPAEKLERKVREIERADVVVVPSRFVLDSLPLHVRNGKRCVIAPFGSPLPVASSAHRPRPASSRLRVLFAGAMSQRKGLADLFEAMRLLGNPDIELVVMGSLQAPLSFYRNQYAGFTYEPPRPHHQVLELMRTCDVLALPAIVEGRALVQQEALASGLPIVVTMNAGGDDLVDEGRTGFLVPIRSPGVLAERLAWFAGNRAVLPAMRQHALRKAALTGWAHYESRVREAVSGSGRLGSL